MDTQEQFEKWMAQAEETLKSLSTEREEVSQPRTSFFNNAPSDADYTPDLGDEFNTDAWKALFQRSGEVDFSGESDLITEKNDPMDDGTSAARDGFSHMVRGKKQITKGDITYPTNPIDPHSVGPDAGHEDGPVRVTKNWNDGDDLKQVDDLKHEIEAMERHAHMADISNNKAMRDKLYKQLESLRDRVYAMSEKMQSKPDLDVT